MWKTFQHGANLYMIKVVQDTNLRLVLTDFQNIWVQEISKDDLLLQFQEANPLFDVKVDEIVTEVTEAINSISDLTDIEISEADEGLKLLLNSIKSEYKIKFKFNFHKSSSETFLKEITVPLIQTVKHLEERQNMLMNLLQKKDRELEEYKLEKGVISRDDLITEKFDEEKLNSIDDKSMMGVFGHNETFWNSFVSQHGNIEATIEENFSPSVKLLMDVHEVEDVMLPTTKDRKTLDFNLLPAKSKKIYELTYRRFMDYRRENKISSFSENELLTYFIHSSKKYKSSSLWSIYSMLKTTLSEKFNLNIGEYTQLRAFLKRQADGYKPKKTKVFKKEQVRKFLLEAPDYKYLSTKVVLIFGIAGACSCDDLLNLKTGHVEDVGSKILVNLPATVSKKSRFFVISEHLNIVRKYTSNRPVHCKSDRFFFSYWHGKPRAQVIGVHRMGSMPREIATYLKLPNPKEYTGHCFRNTSILFAKDSEKIDSKEYTGNCFRDTSILFAKVSERIAKERDPLADSLDFKVEIKEHFC
ncbi:uncharacterized protein LOC123007145 isoform X1 [Tribolium madens]|uniref:uncharacterized protein LOC123007145 isoform X1 n=1 Tax=Tribolium madens TaxID=41895 RepID=UPI001CF73E0B|nr:uncharacterized protein LOC123007145 isoform X1 [Tribolium madens]